MVDDDNPFALLLHYVAFNINGSDLLSGYNLSSPSNLRYYGASPPWIIAAFNIEGDVVKQ